MPQLAQLLYHGCEAGGDPFIQVNKERALSIDHVDACKRILKTPLPIVYSIKIWRYLAIYLLMLPFAELHNLDSIWLPPLRTMLVAYPLLSVDQIKPHLLQRRI